MRAEQIILKQKFSKGFAKTLGDNTVPVQYAKFIRNLRIRDLGITPRLWVVTLYDGTASGTIYGAYGDSVTGRYFRHFEDKWEEIDINTGALTDRSSALTLPKVKTHIFQYAKYIIICTGTTLPYVFDTSTNTLILSTELDAGIFPNFGASFNGFTFLAAGNKVYTSKPVTAALPGNAIKWKTTESDTRQLPYDQNVTGLRGNLERLWIFTDENIEYIDPNTISSVWSTTNIFSQKFAQNQQIINHECVVPVWSKLFYITKGKKIRAINYTAGIAQLQVSDVSDVPLVGIDWFMQEDLANTQEDCVGIFDDERNLIKRYMKTRYSLVNDICVAYDVINTAFLCDDNKNFGTITNVGSRIFATTSTKSNQVFEEETGGSDYGKKITCVYETQDMRQWQSNLKKFYRGAEFGGKINDFTQIEAESYVDGRSVMKKQTIYAGAVAILEKQGIASNPIAGEAIGGTPKVNFDQVKSWGTVITQSQVRLKGKSNRWRLTFSGKDMNFIIDFMALFILPTKKYRYSDKF